MAKVNVYLPDDLEREVREAELSVSPICQAALRDALDRLTAARAGTGLAPPLSTILEDAGRRMAAEGRRVDALELVGSILQHGDNLGARALALLGVDLPPRRPLRGGRRAGELSDDARALLGAAMKVAFEMRHDHLGTEHVVIAAAGDGSPMGEALHALGVTPAALRRQVERLLANPWTTEGETPEVSQDVLERLDSEVQRLAAELDRLKGDQ